MKQYNLNTSNGGKVGVPIDANLSHHKLGCEQCKRTPADIVSASDLALLCLEGSILWKRENEVKMRAAADPEKKRRLKPDEVRSLMKYK